MGHNGMGSCFGFQLVHVLFVDQRVAVAFGAGAHVHTTFHLEVTFVAPGVAPGVLDVPEILAVFAAVAGGQHCMVDLFFGGAAVVDAVHTALVVFEA